MIWIKRNLIIEWNKIDDDQLIKLEEVKETRTQSQNRLYWAYITDLVSAFDDTGIIISINDLHEGLRLKFIQWNYVINNVTWMRMTIRKSSSELNKKEFSKYISDIEKYMIQTYNISCMLPTDPWYK